MRLLRTIPAIPLIALVLLPCIYCGYFQVKQQLIRIEMKEKLKNERLQTVIVPIKDFRWYEENREIIIDGMMFDVKTIRRQNDVFIITGLYDEDETELHIAMGKLQRQDNNGPDASLIPALLSQTLMPPVTGNIVHIQQSHELNCKFICSDEQLYDTVLSLHTPPPRRHSFS